MAPKHGYKKSKSKEIARSDLEVDIRQVRRLRHKVTIIQGI
jgi:hypothetical protein